MIGIIAAMQSEVDALMELMEQPKKIQNDGILFWEGQLSEHEVVLMLSGVGKGNAAMATTLLMKNYPITTVLNIGTAGGLCTNQEVLDLVISDKIVQHDYDTSILDGEEGIGLWYQADQELVSLCKTIFTNLNECCHIGLVASGDQFIAEEEQLRILEQKFPKAMCAEMEAGAIAQVCTFFHVPFVVIRSLSDIAHKEKSHLDFCEYVHMASKRSAMLCKEVVKQLS